MEIMVSKAESLLHEAHSLLYRAGGPYTNNWIMTRIQSALTEKHKTPGEHKIGRLIQAEGPRRVPGGTEIEAETWGMVQIQWSMRSSRHKKFMLQKHSLRKIELANLDSNCLSFTCNVVVETTACLPTFILLFLITNPLFLLGTQLPREKITWPSY